MSARGNVAALSGCPRGRLTHRRRWRRQDPGALSACDRRRNRRGPRLGSLEVAPEGKGRVLLVLGEEDVHESRPRLFRSARLGSPVLVPGAIEVLPLQALQRLSSAPRTWEPRRHVVCLLAARLRCKRRLSPLRHRSALTLRGARRRKGQRGRDPVHLVARSRVSGAHERAQRPPHEQAGSRERRESRGGWRSWCVGPRRWARWQCSLAVERLTFEQPKVQARLGVIVTWDVTKSNYTATRADHAAQ